MAPDQEPCATCGHVAADHVLTEGHRMGIVTAEDCDVPDCICQRFTSERDE